MIDLELGVHVVLEMLFLLQIGKQFHSWKVMVTEIFPKWSCKKWVLSGQIEVWPVMELVRHYWKVGEAHGQTMSSYLYTTVAVEVTM